MARRTIGKPMFLADIPSYIKLKMQHQAISDGIIDNITQEVPQTDSVWNLDPVALQSFPITGDINKQSFAFYFDYQNPNIVGDNYLQEIHHLVSHITQSETTGLYGGILGHNLLNIKDSFGENLLSVKFNLLDTAGQAQIQNDEEEIINYSSQMAEYNGYSLWKINNFSANVTNTNRAKIGLLFETSGANFLQNFQTQSIDIGSITFGRWFLPEHSFDIQATIIKENDGIKRKKTIGGNTITNVNFLGSESWGDLPAWTLGKQKNADYKTVGQTGRRSWKVSLSYIQDDNMFTKHTNENQFFDYDIDTDTYTFDSSLGSFFGLTFDGQIPFLFCPDNNAENLEFAKCVITNKPTFKQVANNLFSTSLVLTEVF
tara:strand:+ start:1185 stop:2303 length:1119 start_codon:yes stop_codon:yes gene_type:complete